MSDITTLMMGAAGAGGGAETDPNFNQTVLLLHGDGTNGAQNNTFLDSSTNNFTITRNGNVTQGSFSPFSRSSGNLVNAPYDPAVHGGSGYFDGTGDYITAPDDADFDFGIGDFTISAWVYPQGSGGIIDQGGGGASTNRSFEIYMSNSSTISNAYISSDGTYQSAYNLTGTTQPNAWNFIEFTRTGGNIYLFVNGAQQSTTSANITIYNSTATVAVGNTSANTVNPFTGYISNVRVVKGSGSSSSTVPTAPLTAVSGTSLLLNFTNAGIFDNTGKNVLETVGNAQIDTATKKYGTGAIEFDGTGDWLKVPNSVDIQLRTGDFTIEFWVYLATGDTGSNRGLVAKGGASTGWLVSLNTTEKVVFTYTTSTITSSGAITLDAWNHIAVVREGTGSNETKIYINGTNDGTGTVSTDFNQTEVMYIGANRAAGDPMKGYIDDLRITKGVARYTTTFTPPDAPFPDQ